MIIFMTLLGLVCGTFAGVVWTLDPRNVALDAEELELLELALNNALAVGLLYEEEVQLAVKVKAKLNDSMHAPRSLV